MIARKFLYIFLSVILLTFAAHTVYAIPPGTVNKPVINSIDPQVITEGDSLPQISVNGTGFLPSAIIYIDGYAVSTHFSDSTYLWVDAADYPSNILFAGTYSITVVNPNTVVDDVLVQGGTSNAVTFVVNPSGQTGLVIIKNTIGGDGEFTFTISDTSTTPLVLNTVAGTNSGFSQLNPGSYSVLEELPPQYSSPSYATWSLTSVSCSYNYSNGPGSTGFTYSGGNYAGMTSVVVLAGKTTTCIFTNTNTTPSSSGSGTTPSTPPSGTPTYGTVTVIKNNVDANGNPTGQDGNFIMPLYDSSDNPVASFTLNTGNGFASDSISSVLPGHYYAAEQSLPQYWSVYSNSCGSLDVVAGQDTTCYVVNKYSPPSSPPSSPGNGTITVLKTNVDASGFATLQDGNFTMPLVNSSGATIGTFRLNTNNGEASDSTSVAPGHYSASETPPANWTLVSNTCKSLDVVAGQDTTCFVVNRYTPPGTTPGGATIVALPNGSLSFTGPGQFVVQPGGNILALGGGTYAFTGPIIFTSTGPNPQTYTISGSGTFILQSGSLSGGNGVFTSTGPGTFIVGGGTQTSTGGSTGKITVHKTAIGDYATGVGDGETFDFSLVAWDQPDVSGSFSVVTHFTSGGSDNAEGSDTITVPAGFYYNINEGGPWQAFDSSGQDVGSWTNDYNTCTETSFYVGAGEDYDCYVENVFSPSSGTTTPTNGQGTIKIIKKSVGGNASFGFNIYPGYPSIVPTKKVIPTTGASGSTPGMGSDTVQVDPGSSYIVEEVATIGWPLTSISCVNQSGSSVGTISFNAATSLPVVAGQTVTCTFTNSQAGGGLKIVKNSIGGNDTFAYNVYENLVSKSIDPRPSLTTTGGSATAIGTASTNVAVTPATSYIIEEVATIGWQLTSIKCVNAAGSQVGTTTGNSVQGVSVSGTGTTTCTFTNSKNGLTTCTPPTVMSNGQCVPGNQITSCPPPNLIINGLCTSRPPGTIVSTGAVCPTSPSYTLISGLCVPTNYFTAMSNCFAPNLYINGSCIPRPQGTIQSINGACTPPTSYTLISGWCVPNQFTSCASPNTIVNGICTPPNTQTSTGQTGKLTVTKKTLGGTGTFGFRQNSGPTLIGNFSLTTGATQLCTGGSCSPLDTKTFDVQPGTYAIQEYPLPPGWSVKATPSNSIPNPNDIYGNVNTCDVTVVTNQTSKCTFTNTLSNQLQVDSYGSLSIDKKVIGGDFSNLDLWFKNLDDIPAVTGLHADIPPGSLFNSQNSSMSTVTTINGQGSTIASWLPAPSRYSLVDEKEAGASVYNTGQWQSSTTCTSILVTGGQTATCSITNTNTQVAPVITSVSPTSKTTCDNAEFTLTVNGSGFTNSVVSFNGHQMSTNQTAGSTTQLTATIPVSEFSSAGSYPIIVTNLAPATGGVSNTIQFTVSAPASGSCTAATPSSSGASSQTGGQGKLPIRPGPNNYNPDPNSSL